MGTFGVIEATAVPRMIPGNREHEGFSELHRVLEEPVLKRELFTEPVIIDRLELLRYRNNFLCRVV